MKSTRVEFITIGRVLAPWGVGGKLKVEVITDFPERFGPMTTVYINRRPVTIDSVEWHRGRAVIKLGNIDDIKIARRLQGRLIEIHSSHTYPLPNGQYYHYQLLGLEVWTSGGERLGKITDILVSSSNDNYVVQGDRAEILVPAIADVVQSVDLEGRRMVIEAIPGLLDLNRRARGTD